MLRAIVLGVVRDGLLRGVDGYHRALRPAPGARTALVEHHVPLHKAVRAPVKIPLHLLKSRVLSVGPIIFMAPAFVFRLV